jgi:FlaA1/EpsC-like NDP-sugar epimerase
MSMTRREFLKRSAVAAAAAASFGTLIARANQQEKVKVGVIGTGAQGQNLLRQLMGMPSAEVVAVCDVYAPNRIRAVELTQFRAQGYSDYRALLERKDIEAVVIASPLHLHAPMTIDALQAGKHVFCEKAIAYSIDESRLMARDRPAHGQDSANRAPTPLQRHLHAGALAHQGGRARQDHPCARAVASQQQLATPRARPEVRATAELAAV